MVQDVPTEKLSPSGYALLGLLGHGPAAGYELGTTAMRTIAHFWPLTRAHIYTELVRLEALGYVESTHVAQEGRPDKRVYALTDAGGTALDEWLNDSTVPPERNRIPMLVKLFFAERMRPDNLAGILGVYRERAQAERDTFATIVDELAEQHPDRVYSRATALYGLRQLDAMLAWLSEVDDLLSIDDERRHTGSARKRRRPPS